MRITIDPTIGETGAWAEGVRRANNILGQMLTQSTEEVTADWTLTHDERGRPLLRLTLSDYTGSVAEKFVPDDLKDAERLWFRLNRLWGDLLQMRSHKLLEKLQESLKGSEEG